MLQGPKEANDGEDDAHGRQRHAQRLLVSREQWWRRARLRPTDLQYSRGERLRRWDASLEWQFPRRSMRLSGIPPLVELMRSLRRQLQADHICCSPRVRCSRCTLRKTRLVLFKL